MCELYKSQQITIRINGNIYYGPIKRMYQTFYDKWIEVPYLDKWFPAKIIGTASEKEIYIVGNDDVWCSFDLVKQINPELNPNKINFLKTNLRSDWLFGIEFQDPSISFFTLKNGKTIPVK